MRTALFIGFCLLLGVSALVGCDKDKTEVSLISEDCPDTVSFMNQVEPWVNLNCSTSGCHDVASAGGYNLNGYLNISANAAIILNVIRHDAGFTAMPLGGGQIEDSLIQHFECWIAQGKQDN